MMSKDEFCMVLWSSLSTVQVRFQQGDDLKGLSHETDFKNVDENGQIFALIRAAAGF